MSLGERISDTVAKVVGSWRFVIIQSTILILWLLWNSLTKQAQFDPYPYILLNLVLSFQAAYTAPLIMMSQNRQAEIDRKVLFGDFEVDQKAHILITEIHRTLHQGMTNNGLDLDNETGTQGERKELAPSCSELQGGDEERYSSGQEEGHQAELSSRQEARRQGQSPL
jgi:uncharacterized membrane protein